MAKIDFRLWEAYKLGKLNRVLTSEEQIEIENCDFAMNLLIPTKSCKKLYDELIREGWTKNQIINIISSAFRVPVVVATVKIHDIENSLSEQRRENDKCEEDFNSLINIEEFIKIYNYLSRSNLSQDKIIKILSIWFETSCSVIEEKINEVNENKLVKRRKI